MALFGKKNACHVLLANEILVTVKKIKRVYNLTHLLVLAIEPPLVQQPLAPQNRRRHHNLTLHVAQEEDNEEDNAPISLYLNKAKKNKKKK